MGNRFWSRRNFLRTVGLGVAGLPLSSFAVRPRQAAGRPNVLFIAVDDLNDWVNCLGGYPGVQTPNLDRLAKRGVLFTNAHCSSPSCNPSRASLLTGIRPTTSGVYENSQIWRDSPVLKNAAAIPQYFRSLGYRVVGGGKIFHGLSWIWARYGRDLNDPACWDEYFPSKTRQIPEEYWPNKDARAENDEIVATPIAGGDKGTRPPWYFDWAPVDMPDEFMSDSKVASWALTELAKKQDRPFFLAVGIFKPHIPWYVPRKYMEMYPLDKVHLPKVKENWREMTPPAGQEIGAERRAWHKWVLDNDQWRRAIQGYLAGISFADAQVGRVLDALDSSPYADNTIIVLWSDNGFHLGERETWEKFTLWEESTRITFMMTVPGVTRPGGECRRAVSLLDIYPTLVELTGQNPGPPLEGTSLVPLLKNPQAPSDRAVVCTWLNGSVVISERWRYIRYGDGSEELYDHESDPDEFFNLASKEESESVKKDLAPWFPEIKIPYKK